MENIAAMTESTLANPGEKVKVVDLVKAKRGSVGHIARRGPLSISHVSRVLSGQRPATPTIRRAAAEVFRVAQRDLLFPLDEAI